MKTKSLLAITAILYLSGSSFLSAGELMKVGESTSTTTRQDSLSSVNASISKSGSSVIFGGATNTSTDASSTKITLISSGGDAAATPTPVSEPVVSKCPTGLLYNEATNLCYDTQTTPSYNNTAANYCKSKEMRLPLLGETSAGIKNGVPSYLNERTGYQYINAKLKYWKYWAGTTHGDSGKALKSRCVVKSQYGK